MRLTSSLDGSRSSFLLLHERLPLLRLDGDNLPLIGVLHRLESLLFLFLLSLLPLDLDPAPKFAHQLRKGAVVVGDEVGVRSLLLDLAVVDADDVVDGGEEVESVRDEDASLVLESSADGVVEEVLADVSVNLC